MKTDKVMAWHFASGWKLRDGTALAAGLTYKHTGPVVMCESGLHASRRPLDALQYAQGCVVSRVECRVLHAEDHDKLVCAWRKVIAAADAGDALSGFARWCASSVLRLWDAPAVVMDFLATGENKDAARAAAWAAARAAALASARAAAWASAKAAAKAAAMAAALAAAEAAQNSELESRLLLILGLKPPSVRAITPGLTKGENE